MLVVLEQKNRTMTVGSCDDRTAPRTAIARSPHDASAVPVKWHGYWAVIVRQSHGDHTMIVRPPYDVSLFESAGVSVLCCIFVLHV